MDEVQGSRALAQVYRLVRTREKSSGRDSWVYRWLGCRSWQVRLTKEERARQGRLGCGHCQVRTREKRCMRGSRDSG